jgi:gluconokinase
MSNNSAAVEARSVLLIGVAGSGKSTVGGALAAEIGYAFYDGDDYHPPANIAKMAQGIALDDADRQPWLDRLHQLLQTRAPLVLACSALKRAYRRRLCAGIAPDLVYLRGSFDLIYARLQARSDHFMPLELLRSQFDTLEEPARDHALYVDIQSDVDTIVSRIVHHLQA